MKLKSALNIYPNKKNLAEKAFEYLFYTISEISGFWG